MLVSEFVIKSTIRIETKVPNGVSTGTGFFFAFLYNEEKHTSVPTIVTNKHVVKNALTGKLRFSIKDNKGNSLSGEYYDLNIDKFEEKWIMHPNPEVDLCVLPIASIHKEIQESKMDLDYACLTMKDIPNSEEINNFFSKIEDITIVGYPDGIWDEFNNKPIVRKGITATALHYDFMNQPKFLVDAAIYGGSSGSPVYIMNQGYYSTIKDELVMGDRLRLVGIIYAVAQHSVNGNIEIIDIPTSKGVVTTNIPNNLGVVIHARELRIFEKIL